MFRTVSSSIIRSLRLYIQHHTIQVPVWRIPDPICTVLDSWWWTERLSETCRVFSSLLYCSNSCTSLHFKTLKSHTKTLKIRPYMFRSPLKPSSGGPWPYFATLLNCNVDLHLLSRVSVCGWLAVWLYVSSFRNIKNVGMWLAGWLTGWLYVSSFRNIKYKECRYVAGWLAGWLYVSSFRNIKSVGMWLADWLAVCQFIP